MTPEETRGDLQRAGLAVTASPGGWLTPYAYVTGPDGWWQPVEPPMAPERARGVSGVQCDGCGRFVGRDGTYHVETCDDGVRAVVGGTCRACLDKTKTTKETR